MLVLWCRHGSQHLHPPASNRLAAMLRPSNLKGKPDRSGVQWL